MIFNYLFYLLTGANNHWKDLSLELEKSDAVQVMKSEEIYLNPPYEFTLSVDCEYEGKENFVIKFSSNNPYKECKHTCSNCGEVIKFRAIDAKEKGFTVDDIFLVSVKNRKWYDDRLFEGAGTHTFTVIQECEKLKEVNLEEIL